MLYLLDLRNTEVGGFKVIVWREDEGGDRSHKGQVGGGGGAIFMLELTPQLVYLKYLFWCKNSSIVCTT